MSYKIVDKPKTTTYKWEQVLQALPTNKAVRVEFTTRREAENARAAAFSYAKYNSFRISSTRIPENDMYALYIWRI